VTLEIAGFNLIATPNALTVTRGGTTTFTLRAERFFDFGEDVALGLVGSNPPGVTFAPTTGVLVGTGISTVTVRTSSSTPIGTITFTVTGTALGIGVTRLAPVTMVVNAP
jgi:hypothetical protein